MSVPWRDFGVELNGELMQLDVFRPACITPNQQLVSTVCMGV